MSNEIRHFLLIFDHNARELVSRLEFDDFDAAVAAYDAAEVVHGSLPHIEVVLFGSESLEVLKRTHPGFFSAAGTSRIDRTRILRDAGWRAVSTAAG